MSGSIALKHTASDPAVVHGREPAIRCAGAGSRQVASSRRHASVRAASADHHGTVAYDSAVGWPAGDAGAD
jgi:hypothetical protein